MNISYDSSSAEYVIGTTRLKKASFIQLVKSDMLQRLINDNVVDLKSISNNPNKPLSAGNYAPYIAAIKTKPFILLAGISGTGKSRVVRELARHCWPKGSQEFNSHTPMNYEMIPVKPNWHDSTELLGYLSNVGTPHYVPGDFLKFIIKAWTMTEQYGDFDKDIPCFLCLDEMNLAPVEQYFAEYLSCVESRENNTGEVVTDSILKVADKQWYQDYISDLNISIELRTKFIKEGISLPPNLVVMGTVNMDETTFAFSRKVLDRAMTIEMNEVSLYAGLTEPSNDVPDLTNIALIGKWIKAEDVANYGNDEQKENTYKVLGLLEIVNNKLDGTPFKIAYRTRNEIVLYVLNSLELGTSLLKSFDESVNMKILPRIEGDANKVGDVLDNLKKVIKDFYVNSKDYIGSVEGMPSMDSGDISDKKIEEQLKLDSPSFSKLCEMENRMTKQYYCTYWS